MTPTHIKYATVVSLYNEMPIPVATRSKAWVCTRSFAKMGVRTPSGAWCLSLVSVALCQVWTYHSSRRILSSVMCLTQC